MSDDEDDLADLLGGGERGTAGALPTSCSNCLSDELELKDGQVVCQECGHLVGEFNITREENDGDMVRHGRGVHMRARGKRQRTELMLAPDDIFNTTDFLHALQLVLQAYVAVLTQERGMPVVLSDVVRSTWLRYCSKWTHYAAPPVHVINGTAMTHVQCGVAAMTAVPMVNTAYLAKLRADRTPPAPVLSPSLDLLAACLCASARFLCLPLMPHNVAAWLRDGTLPYARALLLLPHDLRITMTAAEGMFTRKVAPTAPQLARLTDILARHIGLPQPDVNTLPCALTLLNAVHAPAASSILLRDVLALDELDREVHDVYHPPARNDLLQQLRQRLDRNSAAYVAGAVGTAIMCTHGWREWVAAHAAIPVPPAPLCMLDGAHGINLQRLDGTTVASHPHAVLRPIADVLGPPSVGPPRPSLMPPIEEPSASVAQDDTAATAADDAAAGTKRRVHSFLQRLPIAVTDEDDPAAGDASGPQLLPAKELTVGVTTLHDARAGRRDPALKRRFGTPTEDEDARRLAQRLAEVAATEQSMHVAAMPTNRRKGRKAAPLSTRKDQGSRPMDMINVVEDAAQVCDTAYPVRKTAVALFRLAARIVPSRAWDRLPHLAVIDEGTGMLIDMLGKAVEESPGVVLAHMDAFQLLLQLYTPLRSP